MGRRRADAKLCTRCGERWGQHPHPEHCRRCARELGLAIPTSFERERQHVVMVEARQIAKLAAAGRARYTPPQHHTVIADGHEFEVVNDSLGFGRAFSITKLPGYARRPGL